MNYEADVLVWRPQVVFRNTAGTCASFPWRSPPRNSGLLTKKWLILPDSLHDATS